MATPPSPPARSGQVSAPPNGPEVSVVPKPLPSVGARVRVYRRFWVIAVTVLILDQLSKQAINARLPLGSYGTGANIPIFPGFFNLVHVGNPGAAWSMFSGKGTWLAILASGTLVGVFFGRRQLGLPHPVAQIAFGLLCGGIVGNLVDRIVHGFVVDFLDFHFGSYVYPTFNVADSGICVGVFLYVLWSMRQPAPPKKSL